MALSKDDDSKDTGESVLGESRTQQVINYQGEDARRKRRWELTLVAQEIETE